MITQLGEPCWVLFSPDHDVETHWTGRDDANDAAGGDPYRQIWLRLDLCRVLHCDRCGDPLALGEDPRQVTHFEGLDDAEAANHENGGTCEDCAAAAVLGSVAIGAMRPRP